MFYQYNIVQQLKAMYLQILSPSTSDQSETDPSSKPGGKKLEDKGKKEKSGKEKKDAGKTGKTTDNTKEEAGIDVLLSSVITLQYHVYRCSSTRLKYTTVGSLIRESRKGKH